MMDVHTIYSRFTVVIGKFVLFMHLLGFSCLSQCVYVHSCFKNIDFNAIFSSCSTPSQLLKTSGERPFPPRHLSARK